MPNVQFDETDSGITSRKVFGEPAVPGMVNLLTKAGLVKDKKNAKLILIGIILVCLGITVYLLSYSIPKLFPSRVPQNSAESN